MTDAGLAGRVRRLLTAHGRRARRDAGISLIETMVALGLVGTITATMAPFFANSLVMVGQQRSQQVAIEIAVDAVERAHAVKGSALLAGRGEIKSSAQWNAAPAAVVPYRGAMTLAWDPLLPANSESGDQAPLPTSSVAVTVNGVDYAQSWYLGRCRQQAGAVAASVCENPSSPDPDPATADVFLIQVVVAVAWRHRGCAGGECAYVLATLVSPDADSVFNINRPPPAVNKPPDQFGYLAVSTSLQVAAAGGWLPLTWTATGLPPGLTISAGGLITGTPSATGTYAVTVAATDRKGNSDSKTFSWTIVNPLVLTNPGDQVSRAGTAVTLPIAASGGVGPLSWAATGLPAGLSINSSTGVISGTPTTYETKSVTVTATEANGGTKTATFSWKILTLALVNPATWTTPLWSYHDQKIQASGGVGPYTYRVDDAPPDADLDPNTGQFSGRAFRGSRYITTLYVKDSTGDEVATTVIWYTPYTKKIDLRVTYPDPANPDRTSTVGQPVSWLATADGGSASGYTWSAQGLPPGTTVTQSGYYDGKVSGTPTTPGTYKVKLAVRDANNVFSYMMFYWTVK